MSRHQYIVPPMKRREISHMAKIVRDLAKVDRFGAVDILHVLEVLLPKAFDGFQLEIVEDHVLHGMEGETYPDQLRIRIAESVYEAAFRGDWRARFTIAHEIGHLLLHQGLTSRLARPKPGQQVRAFECSEWQANAFAGDLLTDPQVFNACQSIQEAAERFQISPLATRTQAKALQREGLLRLDFPLN